jgi:hypothetical protein
VRVSISGAVDVEVEADGSYAPDVCKDLCSRAVEVYKEALALSYEDTDDEGDE